MGTVTHTSLCAGPLEPPADTRLPGVCYDGAAMPRHAPHALPLRRLRLLTGIVLWVLTPASGLAQAPPARVVLVSFDGLGAHTLASDPVAEELTNLSTLVARGARARGVQPHTPSTTANTHAALWTGAWGDVNGITGNTMPVLPRDAHTVVERAAGFRADHLRAEPIWLTAARQGVPTVVQQASQGYPFIPATVGTLPSRTGAPADSGPAALPRAPVVVNGYQTRSLSAPRVIRSGDVTRVPCTSGAEPPAVACISWEVGPLTFDGRFEQPTADDPTPRLRVSSRQGTAFVEARATPLEDELPRGRPLARHFSDGLLIDRAEGVGPVVVYFRLFDVSDDHLEFVLYQTAIHELALHDGSRDTSDDVRRLLREAGGFLGNAAGYQWERPDSPLGIPIAEGGDGTSERRYLETLEVTVRQSIAHSAWLWRTYAPRLFVVYTSLPDEMDHRFLALAATDVRYAPMRRWGFQLVDITAGALMDLVTPADHLVFVSDHGLATVTHDVRVAAALQAAGLLALDEAGRIDPRRTQVVPMRNCLVVNGDDWKDGIVPASDRQDVLARALSALRRIVDPDTGAAIVTEVVASKEAQQALGFGGPNGADACVGLAPGYAVDENTMRGAVVAKRRLPKGDHNFLGTRAEMQGILIAAGPRVTAGTLWPALRAIDVAPLVSDLLGIDAPAQAQGTSPLPPR